jgi:hypothetical protein
MLFGIACGNGQFVAAGTHGILVSADGASWAPRNTPITGQLNGVAYGSGRFVVVGASPPPSFPPPQEFYGAVLTSTDGATWTGSTVDTALGLSGVAYGDGQFVAVGGEPSGLAAILTSPDGASWTNSNPSGTNSNPSAITILFAVCCGNGQFVAVGIGGAILTSTDGASWTARNSGTGDYLDGVAFGDGQFVAVGAGGIILTSTDGATWTVRNSGTTLDLGGIAYHSGQFVAVGDYGTIVTSTDGANWTGRNSGTGQDPVDLNGVAYGNGRFVAVGWDERVGASVILTSGTFPATPEVSLAPGPAPVWSADGMSLALDGPVGSNYVIQASSDLVNWSPILSFNITNSPFYFSDTTATNAPARFYRALLQ